MKKKYVCVVCGFPEIAENYLIDGNITSTYEICPSCGFQYGYSNFPPHMGLVKETKQSELITYCRKLWIQGGMQWGWSFKHEKAFDSDKAPLNWNPLEQLKNVPKEFLDDGEKY